MPITKKQTAFALAGAALVQTLAYGGYKLMRPPGEGGAMDENAKRHLEKLREAAPGLLARWKDNPQTEGNPEWEISKILQGRAPDDPSLSEYDKLMLKTWAEELQSWRDLADGKPAGFAVWVPEPVKK